MAYLLIDGYNLIGIAHGNLEKVRNELIQKLRRYSEVKKHHITLVFDGWKSGQKDETEIRTGNLRIIYSRLGEKADHVIKRKLLSSANRSWIVISSDRDIYDFAIKRDFAAVTSAEFEKKLYLTLHSFQKEEDSLIEDEFLKYKEDEIDYPYFRPKGNPRKLSKRERKRLQALKKL
jgi:hypothetical protein